MNGSFWGMKSPPGAKAEWPRRIGRGGWGGGLGEAPWTLADGTHVTLAQVPDPSGIWVDHGHSANPTLSGL
jgi:hypothetical protein